MRIFVADRIETDIVILSEEESKHAIRVLRLNIGDEMIITDGKGTKAHGELYNIESKRCHIKINEMVDYPKLSKDVTIAISPTKNINRFEFFLEKVTEIGVTKIIPIITHNSERNKINRDRLQKIIVSSCKQSQRYHFPILSELSLLSDVLSLNDYNKKYIAHCYFSDDKQNLVDLIHGMGKSIILIGPEGDFTKEEIREAKLSNFEEVSISNQRLRTETAGIVSATFLCAENS